MPIHSEAHAARPLLLQYLAVLRRLTELAELEAVLLDQGVTDTPASLTRPQEALAQDYALLSAALKPRVRALNEAGLLDIQALELGIRHLVALTKENRRRWHGLRESMDGRVDAVMQALPDEDGAMNGRRSPVAIGGAQSGSSAAPPQL